jgi:hypothetical protein
LALILVMSGCGESDGEGAGRPGDASGPPPAGKTAPTEASGEEAVYERALLALEDKDFDTAIAAMESLGAYRDAREKVGEIRRTAARTILAEAKSKVSHSPQASVSQAKTSLKYHPTSEARAFLRRAEAALKRFQAKQEAMGQVDGAGPPAGKGPQGKGPPGKGEDDD